MNKELRILSSLPVKFFCFIPTITAQEHIQEATNLDLENIVSPVDTKVFRQLLTECGYDKKKIEFLCSGFEHGFRL